MTQRNTASKTIPLLLSLCLACCTTANSAPETAHHHQHHNDECPTHHSPTVAKLPEILRSFMSLECDVDGHILKAAEGALWNYPGAYQPVTLPAKITSPHAHADTQPLYFRKIVAKALSQKEADLAYADFLTDQPKRQPQAPSTLEITATNQAGGIQRVYLFLFGKRSIWGYSCQPNCRQNQPFILLKMQGGYGHNH